MPIKYAVFEVRDGKKIVYLYVIIGLTFDDIPIYTKGKIIRSDDSEKFYVLISSKRSVD